MPAHHHCVLSIERAHHPKHWVDAAKATPHFVAWQPQDAVSWVREQLIKHRDQANRLRRTRWPCLLHRCAQQAQAATLRRAAYPNGPSICGIAVSPLNRGTAQPETTLGAGMVRAFVESCEW
jgi:hypothetical protein